MNGKEKIQYSLYLPTPHSILHSGKKSTLYLTRHTQTAGQNQYLHLISLEMTNEEGLCRVGDSFGHVKRWLSRMMMRLS